MKIDFLQLYIDIVIRNSNINALNNPILKLDQKNIRQKDNYPLQNAQIVRLNKDWLLTKTNGFLLCPAV